MMYVGFSQIEFIASQCMVLFPGLSRTFLDVQFTRPFYTAWYITALARS